MTLTPRSVLRITGTDADKFLQDLVTNDVAQDGLVYTALLSPKGKYLFDFFLLKDADEWLLDVAQPRAAALAQRLTMYRLRADVQIEATELQVAVGLGDSPDGAYADPRHSALGWRQFVDAAPKDSTDWDALRVAHTIPEADIELIADDSYILEAGFERLNGVDFKKGCYVGQEITARMKHKTELRKGLARVSIDGVVPVGTEILAKGKSVGQIYTQSGNQAIAYLRFDRATGEMTANDIAVKRID